MTGDKPWYKSRGMLGAIAAIACAWLLLGSAVIRGDIVDQLLAIAVLLAGLLSWVGRKGARDRIR